MDKEKDNSNIEIRSHKDFKFSNVNANRGTERGDKMLAKSLQNYGAGRSGVADKNFQIIGGNHTLQQVAEMDLPIKVVHTTGEEWVVVVRDDLDLNSEEDLRAHELAIWDNRVAEVNLDWNPEVLAALNQAGTDLSQFWRPDELDKIGKDLGQETELQLINSGGDKAYNKAHKIISKAMEHITGPLMLDDQTAQRVQPELFELKIAIENLIKQTPDKEEPEETLDMAEMFPDD